MDKSKKDTPSVIGIGELLWDMLEEGKRLGGAPANVVFHVNALGGHATLVSAVGNDAEGEEILATLRSKNIDLARIQLNSHPTGTVGVTLKDGIPAYVIHEPAAWDHIRPVYPSADCAAVVFGSLAQRSEESRQSVLGLVGALPDSCMKVFDINLRQNFYSKETIEKSLALSSVLKLNDEECDVLAEMFGLSSDRPAAVAELAERFSLRYVILTLGANGSALFDDKTFTQYPVSPCERIVDTVGCGDAFLAAWLLATLNGDTSDTAMRKASEYSALIAGRAGAMD